VSIRPTGPINVLKAQGGHPWESLSWSFIAMKSLKSEPKKKTKTSAKPAVVAPRAGNGKPRYIGVDLHKATAAFHILSHDGKTLHTGSFEVTPKSIRRVAAEHLLPTDQVAVEVTSNTWAFVRLIKPRVAKIVVSNPMKTKAIAEANIKTDKVDAFVLAQLLRCDYLPSVWVPTPAVEDNRALAARRTALVNQRTAIRNRVHAVLARRLITVPAGGLFSVKGLAWLEKLEVDPFDRALIDADLRLLEAIERQSTAIDDMIVTASYDDPDVRLLMTLPGVDYTIAHALKATLADIGRFPSPDKAASYLGLVPRVKQSANKCYNGPITKAGASQVRWLLVQAAQCISRHPGPLGAFFRKLEKRKNRNVAVVATARKLVTIAWHMLKNKEPYRYALPRSTDEKLAAVRVRATGTKRKTGNPKGSKCAAKLAAGKSRTIHSLDNVYVRQGLPARQPLSDGEKRMIRESGTAQYVASLETEKVAPKK
jgi:transposase